jgi:hypothetical protein
MKNQFVSYELSVKLKELGFDEPCLAVYGYTMTDFEKEFRERLVYHEEISLTEGRRMEFDDLKNSAIGFDIAAPLYQQVFDWFREKHNAYTDITRFYGNNIDLPGYRYNIQYDSSVSLSSHVYKEYHEVREKCIEHLINFTENK